MDTVLDVLLAALLTVAVIIGFLVVVRLGTDLRGTGGLLARYELLITVVTLIFGLLTFAVFQRTRDIEQDAQRVRDIRTEVEKTHTEVGALADRARALFGQIEQIRLVVERDRLLTARIGSQGLSQKEREEILRTILRDLRPGELVRAQLDVVLTAGSIIEGALADVDRVHVGEEVAVQFMVTNREERPVDQVRVVFESSTPGVINLSHARIDLRDPPAQRSGNDLILETPSLPSGSSMVFSFRVATLAQGEAIVAAVVTAEDPLIVIVQQETILVVP
jgi:hypothetical protein